MRPDGWELRPVKSDPSMFNYFLHAGAIHDFCGINERILIEPALARPARKAAS